MPPYAGFKSLPDYLDSRCRRDDTNQNRIAEAMRLHRNYINGIYHGRFKPSKKRCDLISAYFGDAPHVLRILVGHELPPPNLDDRQLREIYDLGRSLDYARRALAIHLLRDLRDRAP